MDRKTRPILYISGPYSPTQFSSTEENICVARIHAVRAWERGWAAFTPHLNTQGFEHLCQGVEHGDWLEGDLTIIQRMDPEQGDAMLMLPFWTLSPGATLERKVALQRGLKVFKPLTSLECFPYAPQVARDVDYVAWTRACSQCAANMGICPYETHKDCHHYKRILRELTLEQTTTII